MEKPRILDSNNLKSDIHHVCFECGISANVVTCLYRYGAPPLKLCFTTSTYYLGRCDWCEETKHITEVRDFFYPDFTLVQKAKNIFDRKAKNKKHEKKST
jgi:hypothetical protein